MATFNKFQQFVEDKNHGVHNLGSDVIKLYLTDSTPDPAAHTVKGDIAGITTGNNYQEVTLTPSGSSQTSGVYKLIVPNATITASGGTVGAFRYVVIYNSTAANGPLIGYIDYGSSVTLADGEDFVVNFSESNGVITDT